MTRFIVAAGKGGAGKTTLALNLGTALAQMGRKTIVLDGSLANPGIGLHLGIPAPEKHLHHVLSGFHRIHEALHQHPSGMMVIPASIRTEDMENVTVERLYDLKPLLHPLSEYVIIDSSPGFSRESLTALKMADEAVLLVHPELASVAEAMRLRRYAEQHGVRVLGSVLNQVRGERHELTSMNIRQLLGTRILASVPEDPAVRASLAYKQPVVYSHPGSDAAAAFKQLALVVHG
ncbi:MAG: cell division ATPase MinD [Nanoarchaeota archaeon]